MLKNFDNWNEAKKTLENNEKNIVFHERDIWWCSLGINLGDEQDGKNNLFERPILILKKFNKKIAIVLPITTKNKNNIYYSKINFHQKESCVILSQIRLISAKRLCRFVGKLSPKQFSSIQNNFINILTTKRNPLTEVSQLT